MAPTIIKNFTKRDEIEIRSGRYDNIGPLVMMSQTAGSMYLSHSMTPAQAREMAAALVAHANALEA